MLLGVLSIYLWSLLKPKKFSTVIHRDTSRGNLTKFFLPTLLVLFVVIGITAPAQTDTKVLQTTANVKPLMQETSSVKGVSERKPVIETVTRTETEVIPFKSTSVNDPAISAGTTTIRTVGINGLRTKTYLITMTDGQETARKLVSDTITQAPVDEITHNGTKRAVTQSTPVCDKNYSGCVPVASDVDCAGGSGNGPAYVAGPINVIGNDIYGLDRDNDGIACE